MKAYYGWQRDAVAMGTRKRLHIDKKTAVFVFKHEIMPSIVERYGDDDVIAIREAWDNYTDGLCKDGQITEKQYDTWSRPF